MNLELTFYSVFCLQRFPTVWQYDFDLWTTIGIFLLLSWSIVPNCKIPELTVRPSRPRQTDGRRYYINIIIHERVTWEIVTPRKPMSTEAKSRWTLIFDKTKCHAVWKIIVSLIMYHSIEKLKSNTWTHWIYPGNFVSRDMQILSGKQLNHLSGI